MEGSVEDLYVDAIRRGLVVFAPKGVKQLREQYPELSNKKMYPELANLGAQDMMFVFLFRAACSPFADEEDRDKVVKCINIAYKSELTREKKVEDWKDGKGFRAPFPAAFERMKHFNASARIIDYQAMMVYRANCLEAISDSPGKGATPKQRQEYLEMAAGAMKGLENTTAILEAGSYGVEEAANTILPSLMGSLADFRTT